MATDCSCDKCAALCLGNPGWFAPAQVLRAAAHLKLSFRDMCAQYLIIEYWVSCPNIYVLAPRRIDQVWGVAGWGDNFRRGKCRLLSQAGCLLPHSLRPVECAGTYACGDNVPGSARAHLADLWADDPHGEIAMAMHTLGVIP